MEVLFAGRRGLRVPTPKVSKGAAVKQSAGILTYRLDHDRIEVLLVHPGGPFWQNRDLGAWSIPKGEYLSGESPDMAARREFTEETGWPPLPELHSLGQVRQAGGKLITAFAMKGDFPVETLISQTFEIVWPPHTQRIQSFPEVDRAEWFTLKQAWTKILPAQRPFLDRLEALVLGISEQ